MKSLPFEFGGFNRLNEDPYVPQHHPPREVSFCNFFQSELS